MERESDVQLIQRILSGDEAAFSILVDKHQKGVHALAWRKVGDFHDAEEITQDTFLQVYKKLPTLKDPYKFAGWLYVIANRLCIDWIRKKNLAIQSLEDTPVEDIEKSSYTHHVLEQSEIASSEHRRELVKKLLAKLPESERTVMTLHYLGEMTVKEISKFLGVSVSAIHNRLYRARKRLQAQEESLVQEVLSSVQIPASVKQNIMRRAADINLTPPPASKPLLPWVAFGTAVVLVALLIGVSNQHLIRFQ
ncbi:RNA polymerase sigma factor [Candidatus Poribacteria bacterium]|nr:RNA polymerase sigma factor [Candidatus Poribacteria bacterium]MYK94896.1 RNA polymerase sigma factor [Candidatus Poribacteria bacterium]